MKNFHFILMIFIAFLTSCSDKKEMKHEQSNIPTKTELKPNTTDKVYEGDAFLQTQEHINEFGKNNYTFINGKLIIGDETSSEKSEEEITLEPLKSLKFVDGEMKILSFKNIENTQGLENLEVVNGTLTISGNHILEIGGFDHLHTINGDLIFGGNSFGSENSMKIVGFQKIKKLKNLYITGNDNLTVLDAFHNLEEVNTLQIMNSKLEKIDNFKSLKTVKKNLSIEYCENLKKVDFPNLESISGWLAFNENESYNGEISIPKIKKINHLYFNSNRNFENYCGFSEAIKLQKIGTLTSENNKANATKSAVLQKCK